MANSAKIIIGLILLAYLLKKGKKKLDQIKSNITKQEFINLIKPAAVQIGFQIGVPYEFIIAQIALEIDLSPVDYYLENIVQINDLSKMLIDLVLYNKFHSSISTNTLSMKQKFILLLYVRHLVMKIYNLTEEDTKGNLLINILMAKIVSQTTKTLTQKDLNGIKKYIKLNNLKSYLLSEKNTNMFIESIMHCVLASYTIVNHNSVELSGTPLLYESGNMTLSLLDMVIQLFEFMK